MKKVILSAAVILFAVYAHAQSKNNEYHLDKDYTIASTGKLSLRCSDAKVTIVGSSRSTAHVKIDREVVTKGWVFGTQEFSVDVSERDGNLDIRDHSSGSVSMVGYHYEKYEIRIEVPAGVSISVDGDDGDFDLRDIQGSVNMTIDDGDIHLTNCTGKDFRFRMDDGDLTMDQGRGDLDIDADDADVDIRGGQFESIVADVDDGDLVIDTSLSDTGSYRIDSQDGLVALTIISGGGEFSIRHDDGHVSASGNFETLQESKDYTQLRLANGNAKVSIQADDARVKLSARM